MQRLSQTLLGIGVDKSAVDEITSKVPTLADLLSMSEGDIYELIEKSMADSLLDKLDAQSIHLRLDESDFNMSDAADIFEFVGSPGRPLGAKDKVAGSRAREIAGRLNAAQVRIPTPQVEEETEKERALSSEEIKRYGKLYQDALKGDYVGLENSMSQVLGLMYALYLRCLRALSEKEIDVPIKHVGPDGHVVIDSNGRDVIRGFSSLKATVTLAGDLRRALGIDVAEMVVSAKSQDRKRSVSTSSTLDEVEKGFEEFEEARRKYGGIKKEGN